MNVEDIETFAIDVTTKHDPEDVLEMIMGLRCYASADLLNEMFKNSPESLCMVFFSIVNDLLEHLVLSDEQKLDFQHQMYDHFKKCLNDFHEFEYGMMFNEDDDPEMESTNEFTLYVGREVEENGNWYNRIVYEFSVKNVEQLDVIPAYVMMIYTGIVNALYFESDEELLEYIEEVKHAYQQLFETDLHNLLFKPE